MAFTLNSTVNMMVAPAPLQFSPESQPFGRSKSASLTPDIRALANNAKLPCLREHHPASRARYPGHLRFVRAFTASRITIRSNWLTQVGAVSLRTETRKICADSSPITALTEAPNCSVGKYDKGARQIDCGFPC